MKLCSRETFLSSLVHQTTETVAVIHTFGPVPQDLKVINRSYFVRQLVSSDHLHVGEVFLVQLEAGLLGSMSD